MRKRVGIPVCRLSERLWGTAPNRTTWTVTSKSFRKTERLLILSSARAGAGAASAQHTPAPRRTAPREALRPVAISQPAHYSVRPEGPAQELPAPLPAAEGGKCSPLKRRTNGENRPVELLESLRRRDRASRARCALRPGGRAGEGPSRPAPALTRRLCRRNHGFPGEGSEGGEARAECHTAAMPGSRPSRPAALWARVGAPARDRAAARRRSSAQACWTATTRSWLSACPALRPTTCPITGRPRTARSPTTSRIL